MRSAEQPPAVQNASALSRRLVGSGNCLQANGSPKGIVDEIPGNLRKIASPRDGLDIAKERPVWMLYRQVESQGLKEDAL
mmetsp:Transcript_10777/g.31251  ORF Transcript_10777/g.31251 Transcript_10777/m.31251 type:complete len:80 (-) Transcript_10777:529-768(-)